MKKITKKKIRKIVFSSCKGVYPSLQFKKNVLEFELRLNDDLPSNNARNVMQRRLAHYIYSALPEDTKIEPILISPKNNWFLFPGGKTRRAENIKHLTLDAFFEKNIFIEKN